jgi:hypothetical protein
VTSEPSISLMPRMYFPKSFPRAASIGALSTDTMFCTSVGERRARVIAVLAPLVGSAKLCVSLFGLLGAFRGCERGYL